MNECELLDIGYLVLGAECQYRIPNIQYRYVESALTASLKRMAATPMAVSAAP